MSESLGRPAWMVAPATQAVMAALEAAGGMGCARFVGGCVRNAILGAPVDDVDIATTLTPDAVTEALKAAGLKAVPTGVEHGTVTAVSERRPYEITTLRRDVATDGRRAVVAFTTDWAEDAGRRDFTLNALYAGPDGVILDPVGGGIADARAGRIVFVGEPERRIEEDYLRILRFFRFLAWYGKGEPDERALLACAALKEGLGRLAAERVSKELLKLLAAPDPTRVLALMEESGVLAMILPAAPDLKRLGALDSADPLLRLAALLPDQPELGADFAGRLRLSNAERDRLTLALDPAATPVADPAAIRRAVHRFGGRAVADRARLAGLDASVAELAEGWTVPALPVSGADALAAGASGPAVGVALRAVEAWWVAADFPTDREAALARLREAIAP